MQILCLCEPSGYAQRVSSNSVAIKAVFYYSWQSLTTEPLYGTGPLKTSSICFCSKTISSHQERQPQSCKTSIFFNSMNVILLHLKMQLAEWECKSSKRESQEQPKGDEIPMPTLHLETILCWTVLETRAPGLSLDGFKRGPLGHHLPPTQTTLKF